MSVIHRLEGFDGLATSDIVKIYSIAGTPEIDTVVPRTGRACLKCRYLEGIGIGFDAYVESFITGFAFRFPGPPPVGSFFTAYQYTSTTTTNYLVALKIDGTGRIEGFVYPSTSLGFSQALLPDTWYYIEFKFKRTTSTVLGDIELKVNGITELLPAAGINTALSGREIGTLIFMNSSNISFTYHDDIYVIDTEANPTADFLGPSKVQILRPNGNGNYSQWDGSDGNQTDNYLLVDDTTPDGDTTYIEAQNAAKKDSYAFENISNTSNIHAVQTTSFAENKGEGVLNMRNISRVNSTDYNGDDIVVPSGQYIACQQVWDEDPDTSAAWTESGLNAAEFGVEARS